MASVIAVIYFCHQVSRKRNSLKKRFASITIDLPKRQANATVSDGVSQRLSTTQRACRSRLACRFARNLVGLASVLVLAAGCRPDAPPTADRWFEVAGPSMSPTFLGKHEVETCTSCDVQTRIPSRLTSPPAKPFRCW